MYFKNKYRPGIKIYLDNSLTSCPFLNMILNWRDSQDLHLSTVQLFEQI